MRGKLFERYILGNWVRITPADAGKTLPRPTSSATFWDHPRGCGENPYVAKSRSTGLGSPPRMRGKPAAAAADTMDTRITPADAGKTDTGDVRLKRAKDHPRGCGENLCKTARRDHRVGSPPRMRGKRVVYSADKAIYGITPADAGKTLFGNAVLYSY